MHKIIVWDADDIGIQSLAREIYEWAEETFPNRTDASMYLKLYSEVAEVIESNGKDDEVADLFILLLDYSVRKGIHLPSAIKSKLSINRNREWEIRPDGTMKHKE